MYKNYEIVYTCQTCKGASTDKTLFKLLKVDSTDFVVCKECIEDGKTVLSLDTPETPENFYWVYEYTL